MAKKKKKLKSASKSKNSQTKEPENIPNLKGISVLILIIILTAIYYILDHRNEMKRKEIVNMMDQLTDYMNVVQQNRARPGNILRGVGNSVKSSLSLFLGRKKR